jgi:phage shock protein A
MRLFQRIGDIIAANLNEMVDRFEDPEVMLKHAIREMETMIESATGGAARAIAGERLVGRELSDHQRKASRWTVRAENAVIQGDDDLARQAIVRAHEHEAMATVLIEQRKSAERTAQALRGQVNAMRAKQAEARRKLESLSARRQLAETSRAVRGMAVVSSRKTNGFARYEQMQRQIEQAEAEAEAMGELCENSELMNLEADAESREQARRVEAELAAIKARLGTVQKPVG